MSINSEITMNKVCFYCQSCGHETHKWLGKCPACNKWNTIIEEIKSERTQNNPFSSLSRGSTPTKVQNIQGNIDSRFSTFDRELDIVLGGGIVEGSDIDSEWEEIEAKLKAIQLTING